MSFIKNYKPLPLNNDRTSDLFIRPSAIQIAKTNQDNSEAKLNNFGEPAFFQPQNTIQTKKNDGQLSKNVNTLTTSNPTVQLKKETLKEKLDRITKTYKEMIKSSRKKGYDVAADNLQRFLDGTGGIKKESSSWLRSFTAITSAQKVNEGRFEKALSDLALKVGKGKTKTFSDYWDRQLTASVFTELYYASGTSSITSTGTFKLTRVGDKITITGTVTHKWHDPYDWHAGLAAYIPGYGSISDADALLLQKHRGAAPFKMESTWKSSVKGTYIIDDTFYFDSQNYKWTTP